MPLQQLQQHHLVPGSSQLPAQLQLRQQRPMHRSLLRRLPSPQRRASPRPAQAARQYSEALLALGRLEASAQCLEVCTHPHSGCSPLACTPAEKHVQGTAPVIGLADYDHALHALPCMRQKSCTIAPECLLRQAAEAVCPSGGSAGFGGFGASTASAFAQNGTGAGPALPGFGSLAPQDGFKSLSGGSNAVCCTAGMAALVLLLEMWMVFGITSGRCTLTTWFRSACCERLSVCRRCQLKASAAQL